MTRPTVLPTLLFAGLFVVPAAIRAQTVMGQVVDSASHRPLAGVAVRLVRAAPDSAAVADSTLPAGRTGADGVFTLVAPSPGRYRVRLRDDVEGPELALATADTVDEHLYVVPSDADRVYEPAQVDRRPTLRGPFEVRYPEHLMTSGVAGCVALQLVVGVDGRPERASVRALGATSRDFADAAVAGAKSARYQPAERAGRPVRSMVRFPVAFSIVGRTAPDRSPCVRAAGPDAAEGVEVTASRTY